jgi:hypothetical protein
VISQRARYTAQAVGDHACAFTDLLPKITVRRRSRTALSEIAEPGVSAVSGMRVAPCRVLAPVARSIPARRKETGRETTGYVPRSGNVPSRFRTDGSTGRSDLAVARASALLGSGGTGGSVHREAGGGSVAVSECSGEADRDRPGWRDGRVVGLGGHRDLLAGLGVRRIPEVADLLVTGESPDERPRADRAGARVGQRHLRLETAAP